MLATDDSDVGNVSQGVAKGDRLLIVHDLPRNDRDAPANFHDGISLPVGADDIGHVIAIVRGLSRRRRIRLPRLDPLCIGSASPPLAKIISAATIDAILKLDIFRPARFVARYGTAIRYGEAIRISRDRGSAVAEMRWRSGSLQSSIGSEDAVDAP